MADELNAAPDHHPSLFCARRYGCWCSCTCTWQSRSYTTVSGAHLAFREHLVAAQEIRKSRT